VRSRSLSKNSEQPAALLALRESARSQLLSGRRHGADADTLQALESELDACERLLADTSLRATWEALRRRSVWAALGGYGLLVKEIAAEMQTRRRTPTNAARRDQLLSVAAKARELRRLLDASEDLGAPDFADASGTLVNVRAVALWLRERGVATRCAKEAADALPRALRLLLLSGEAGQDGEAFGYAAALEHLESVARERAARARYVGQPGSRTAPALSLALRLGHLFQTLLGAPLHEHVAAIVNAVNGSSLTRDNVRALANRRGKRKRS
jgi:hypothetical protein